MLDQFTFGKEKAAVILAERINNIENLEYQKKIAARIGHFFSEFNQGLEAVQDIHIPKILLHVRILWYKDFKRRAEHLNIPSNMISYVQNLLKAKHQEAGKVIKSFFYLKHIFSPENHHPYRKYIHKKWQEL